MGEVLGCRLKSLRESRCLKPADVAKELEVTERAYRNYESNDRDVSTMTLLKLCLYFNVSSEYFLGLDHEQKSPPLDEGEELKRTVSELVDELDVEQTKQLIHYVHYLIWLGEQS